MNTNTNTNMKQNQTPENDPAAKRVEWGDTVDISPSDRVIDRDALMEWKRSDGDLPSVAVVIDQNEKVAHSVPVGDTGKSVADFNPEYPSDDRVFSIAFIGGSKGMNETVGWPNWRRWSPENFPAEMAIQQKKQSNAPKLYSYPGVRLIPVGKYVDTADSILSAATAQELIDRQMDPDADPL